MNPIEITPQKTWAVVVGIDRYLAGSEWNLDGPVNDACAFARWLQRRGVPAEQILFFLSPKKDAIDGLVTREAEADLIHKAFERELPVKDGDLLIVFWGGHGALNGDERLLFCADAVNDHKSNLNLNDLLSLLRTSRYRHLDHQIIIVDACANYLNWMDEPASLPKREFGKGRMIESKGQFIIYSAADGEAAINNQTRKTGEFSRFVLDWLETDEKEDTREWPPDFDRMAREVKSHFDELRKREQTHQTPICIRLKSWRGDEENLFGNLAEANERSMLMAEVREQLRPHEIDTETWRSFYDLTSDYFHRPFAAPQTRDAMIRNLVLASPEPDHPKPVFEFVWRAAHALHLDDLKKWAEKKINDGAHLANLHRKIYGESPEPILYLMVKLQSSASLKRPFAKNFNWWLWHGSRRTSIGNGVCNHRGSLEDLRTKFLDLLNECRDVRRAGALHLEFFLDIGMMLSLEIDQWTHRHSLLGAIYPMAVRWTRPLEHRGDWQRLARRIRGNAPGRAAPAVDWLSRKSPNQLSPHLINNHNCGPLFGFSKTPTAETLQIALEGGAPFIFWPRTHGIDPPVFEEKLAHCASAGSLEQFPQRVRQLREGALDVDCHPGASLTLLWDDPDRVPVEWGFGSNE
jgi:hypothetical protein